MTFFFKKKRDADLELEGFQFVQVSEKITAPETEEHF